MLFIAVLVKKDINIDDNSDLESDNNNFEVIYFRSKMKFIPILMRN